MKLRKAAAGALDAALAAGVLVADDPGGAPSTLFDRASTGANLDKTLRDGFGGYDASSFGKLLATADSSTPHSQEFTANLDAGETIFAVFTCTGSGSVDVAVSNHDEDVLHVWNKQCGPDIAYAGESPPMKSSSDRLTLMVKASSGVRYFAMVEGAKPPPLN